MVHLTEAEIDVLDNPSEEDLRILEGIKDLDYDTFQKEYDCYRPTDMQHYLSLEREWLQKEKYFLGIKEHHNPLIQEFLEDISKSHIGEKFKAFYVEKFPEKVEKI